jgi:16S rRNA (cytosine967-C5)-methyltransferase
MNKPTAKPTPPSARTAAAQLLEAVLGQKRTLDEAVAASPLAGIEADQKFAMLLVLTVLRHLGQIDAVIARYMDKPLPAKRRSVTNALRLGVAQLLILETPAHAAVNETVTVVKRGKDTGLSGLVNAVLQKIAREKPTLGDAIANLPADVVARWSKWYGADAVRASADVAALRPPLDLNFSPTLIHKEIPLPLRERLGEGARSGEMSETKLETPSPQPSPARGEGGRYLDRFITRMPADHPSVESLSGYSDGAFFVQDLAASYPVRLLGDVNELQVLDLCAAPGGKAMQLMASGAFVTAVDQSPSRMRRLKENFARMKMQANLVTADIMQWKPSRAYDAVLLDAPCSATGTWRRHPEVVHLVTPLDIAQLVQLQRDILTRAWEWVKPGGKLVYCVCSLERDEGEAQAEWFMREQKDAKIIPVPLTVQIPAEAITPEGYLRTLPSMNAAGGGMDGFFAVCFEKA